MKYVLPELPIPYDSLEPYIDEMTMRIHHTKHHQGYINQLNTLLEPYQDHPYDQLIDLLSHLDALPDNIRTGIRNNGGGHYNHMLFFEQLKNNPNGTPKTRLLEAINRTFGSFDAFKNAFAEAAKTRFGSGWAWLIVNSDHQLEIVSMPNQDPITHATPLLGLDVWEHAYYLKYQNRRPEYIENFFHVINWDVIEDRYLKAIQSS